MSYPRISRKADLAEKGSKIMDYYNLLNGIRCSKNKNVCKDVKDKVRKSKKKKQTNQIKRTKKKEKEI
jgi:hypothetical protein